MLQIFEIDNPLALSCGRDVTCTRTHTLMKPLLVYVCVHYMCVFVCVYGFMWPAVCVLVYIGMSGIVNYMIMVVLNH